MSKKSLDILEEQLFGLLEDYAPQTGRGFSDGNEYVGKNTKGPYEDAMAEADNDQPWYKKVYKKDSKNLKILIGHGTKTPKHAKKGEPYSKDPPARRPVNKLSAPPMALQENETQINNTSAFLLAIQNAKQGDKLNFFVTKRIDLKPGSFCLNQIYTAEFIDNDTAKMKASFVFSGDNCEDPSKMKEEEKTKSEIIEKFKEKMGNQEICSSLDCKRSTFNGRPLEVVLNDIKKIAANQTQNQKQEPITIQGQQEVQAQQDTQVAVGVGQRVANGTSVQTAIKQELGYNPITKAFAKEFYSTMTPVIQKIKDPDEKKVAALTTVLFGEVALIPVEFMANVYSSIDPEIIKQLSGLVDDFIKNYAPELAKLKELYGKAKEGIEKAKEGIEKVLNPFKISNLNDLPQAEQGVDTVVVIGDKQKAPLLQSFGTFFSNKGYNKIGQTFDIAEGSDFSGVLSDPIIKYITTNKNNIGVIFISLGTLNPAQAAQFYSVVSSLKESAPKSKIIWVGSPPLQKGADEYIKKNIAIKGNNILIKTGSITQGKEFIFIDPTQYLTSEEEVGVYSDKTTLTPVGAKKIFDGAIADKKTDKKEEPKKKEDEKITVSDADIMLPVKFIEGAAGIAKFTLLDTELKRELIKLSKRAKQVFGEDAKIHIQSGQRDDSANHKPGQAVDMRISIDGTNLSAQKTYAFIISSIISGVIKDGGVGYYANNKGIYDPDKMDTSTEYPHYDIRGVRKWFWFDCESDEQACRQRVKSNFFKKKKDYYQTSGDLTAAQVAGQNNPLSLPKDVFDLIGTYRSKEKPASIVDKKSNNVSESKGSVQAFQYEGKDGRSNKAVKYPNGEIKVGGSISWRNNNPGNIRSWKNLGGIGEANGFAVFETYEKGYEALKKYVERFAFESSNHTIETFMGEYAPTRDEDGKLVRINKQYGKIIADSLGVTPETKTSSLKGNQRALEIFAQVIQGVEGYDAYKNDRRVISSNQQPVT